jgi:hypothetical protein
MNKQQIPPAPDTDQPASLTVGLAVRIMHSAYHWQIGRVAGQVYQDPADGVEVCLVDIPLIDPAAVIAVAHLLPIEGETITQKCGHIVESWPHAAVAYLESMPCYSCWKKLREECTASDEITVAQHLLACVAHDLSVIARRLEEATNRLEVWRQCVANMSRQELVDTCHELGLLLSGKQPTHRNSNSQLATVLLEYKRGELHISDLLHRHHDLQRDVAQARLALKTAEARVELARRGAPLTAQGASEGLHVWAIAEGDLYECVVVELGTRSDSDTCALCFARPWEVPQYMRIGWRTYGELVAIDTGQAEPAVISGEERKARQWKSKN